MLAGTGVRIIEGDALRSTGPRRSTPSGWVLVANLPYNIATPLVLEVLEGVPAVERMLVMVQREVGERLAAGAGRRPYGAASVRVACWASAEVVGEVPATVFMPKPKVESALVEIVRRPPPVDVDRAVGVRAGSGRLRHAPQDAARRAGRAGVGGAVGRGRRTAGSAGRGARPRRVVQAGGVEGPTTGHERALAKLTLSLRVVGLRGDGFHLLDAEMVTLDLADELTLTPAPTTTIEVEGAVIEGDNLIAKALRAVGRRAHVRLVKRIPMGAGLGGGSADAAAVLRWAGCDDTGVAASLGADVPFCVRGGRARVTGVGEEVDALLFEDRVFTLLTPPLHVSTPAVYRTWDDLGGPVGDNGNDLEPAAVVVEPELLRWRDVLGDATGRTPRLAGSGSTWFVEGDFPGEGRVVTRTARR